MVGSAPQGVPTCGLSPTGSSHMWAQPHGVPTLPDFAQALTFPVQPTIAFPTGPACYDCHIKSCHLFRLKSSLRCHHQGCWFLTFDPPVSLPYAFSSCPQIASLVASLLPPFVLGCLLAILQGVVDTAFLYPHLCIHREHLSVGTH